MNRETVLEYAKMQYQTIPDHPWKNSPDNAVLRHGDNRKWYGLIMYISREKLGLSEKGMVDILNVKCDPVLAASLRSNPGVFPAYHMNHAEWISILLDGTVKKEQVFNLLDLSYSLTASAKKRASERGCIEWIVPANPRYYDVEEDFQKSGFIDWKQSSNVRVGDTVYLYMGAPVSAILYKLKAIEVDIPYHYEDKFLSMDKVMRLQLLERYDQSLYPMALLKEHGVFAVRGPRSMPASLSREINGK
ncbi:MAG: MmcQ/YjbR family DNA-binding protein [Lachnospiraceae bacterium]|nr:MmcQ/YjbR family DNA-binding protein [Lachnospiraceae bacterium]